MVASTLAMAGRAGARPEIVRIGQGDRQTVPSGPQPEVDCSIVRAAARGDRAAFTAIVKHYDGRLRSLAYHLLGDRDLTDDVLQDVYLKVFRGLPSFKERSSLGTWLTRITYTTAMDQHRKRTRLISLGEVQHEDSGVAPDTLETLAAEAFLSQALRSLPIEQRAVVVLVGVQGLEYRQAAEILGIPPGTVASRLAGARQRLRTALRPEKRATAAPPTASEVPS